MSRVARAAYFAAASAFVLVFVTLFGRGAGALPAAIIGGSMVLALVAWAATTLRRDDPLPDALLTAYLWTGLALMVHVWEEFTTGFAPRIAQVSGSDWDEAHFVHAIVFFGPIVWIAGALALASRNPLGGFMAWFLFIAMAFAEPVHYVFPVVEGDGFGYFPGLWTALLPMVPAAWGIRILLSQRRKRVSKVMVVV